MDLKSYLKDRAKPSAKTENVEEMLDKYKNFSETDLMNELMKSKNNMNPNMMEDMFKNISPYLNEEQKSKFNNLKSRLK